MFYIQYLWSVISEQVNIFILIWNNIDYGKRTAKYNKKTIRPDMLEVLPFTLFSITYKQVS